MTVTVDEDLTFADLFCGAGGSITGMVNAGLRLVLGANHSERAIETVSSNYRDADFLCADINNYDMRRLPHTRVLWASVICTEGSPAGGNKKLRGQGVLDLEEHGHIPAASFERTRACALDVVRATEIHRYDAIVVENVVEFATTWELYDWWVEGMCKIRPGYNVQVVNVSAAHIYDDDANDPAPQWRDRIYIVFTRKGIPLPDLEPRPPSWCPTCEGLVEGRQVWKRQDRRRIGKYGQQYVYRCPIDGDLVEPLVLPAVSALDMDDVGQRIGDRKKPLAANTLARIEWGIRTFWSPVVATVAGNTYERPGSGYYRAAPAEGAPLSTRTGTGSDALATPTAIIKAYGDASEAHHRSHPVTDPLGAITATKSHGLLSTPTLLANANHDDTRVQPAVAAPLPARTSKIGDVVVNPPMVVVNRTNNRPRRADGEPVAPVTTGENQMLITDPLVTTARRNSKAVPASDDALATVTGQGRHHELVHPPPLFVKNFGGNAEPPHLVHPVDSEPLGTITTRDGHALVVPYRRGRAKTTAEPLHTMATRDSAALVTPDDLPIDVMDCFYRMLHPREHLRAQRFRDSYVVAGNRGEITLQAGNAVPCNVAQWIGGRLIEVLA